MRLHLGRFKENNIEINTDIIGVPSNNFETNLNPKDSKAKNEEEEVLDRAADEIVKKFLKGDDITISGEFPIMSFGDVTYMNVAVNEKAERVDPKTKKKYIQDEWVVEHDSDKPLRNI